MNIVYGLGSVFRQLQLGILSDGIRSLSFLVDTSKGEGVRRNLSEKHDPGLLSVLGGGLGLKTCKHT